jgi:hypothetical protein
MKKQTAVEWLFNQIKKSSKKTDNINNDHLFFYRLLEEAKAMEKEQIIEANEDCSTNELGELFKKK